MKPFNPWPAGILLAFALFIAGTVTLVVIASSQRSDLVRSDYYDHEVRHQQHMDTVARTRAVAPETRVTCDAPNNLILLSLPQAHASRASKGEIHFYRPSAANLDRRDLLARMLAETPARVHERGGDGPTPLHFARSRPVVDLLLDAGADLDARDVDHRSTAAEWMLGDKPAQRRTELAKYLVQRGASADIFLVAALGLADRASAMLRANPSLLALRTSQGEYAEKAPSSYHIYQWTIGPNLTPLQVAAKFGQRETIETMKQFASPAQQLLLACHEGQQDEARAIVQANPGIIEGLDPADRRALTDEAWSANAPAVELMLELGFDPSQASITGPTGGNALHCAAWEGAVACVSAILRYPAGRALLEARDTTYQGTPLGWCCHGSVNCGNPRADHAEVARLLLLAGARPDPEMRGCSDAMQAVLEAALRES